MLSSSLHREEKLQKLLRTPLFSLMHLQRDLVRQTKAEKLDHHPHFLPYVAFRWTYCCAPNYCPAPLSSWARAPHLGEVEGLLHGSSTVFARGSTLVAAASVSPAAVLAATHRFGRAGSPCPAKPNEREASS